ncbi:VanZ family protein [Radiobacillus sp. PE A8.2]|uniref:VanZ family protein n=1 Tax=Radiobacillus sp. PE A8.2 TaxID=3380349 RepID=UPI003890C855
MKYIFLITWIVIIFISTCTHSTKELLQDGNVYFTFIPSPNFLAFISFTPNHVNLPEFFGHTIMFFLLTYLFIKVNKDLLASVFTAIAIGISTEMLQPFFSRTADVVDLAADMLGISIFIILYLINGRFSMITNEN